MTLRECYGLLMSSKENRRVADEFRGRCFNGFHGAPRSFRGFHRSFGAVAEILGAQQGASEVFKGVSGDSGDFRYSLYKCKKYCFRKASPCLLVDKKPFEPTISVIHE